MFGNQSPGSADKITPSAVAVPSGIMEDDGVRGTRRAGSMQKYHRILQPDVRFACRRLETSGKLEGYEFYVHP